MKKLLLMACFGFAAAGSAQMNDLAFAAASPSALFEREVPGASYRLSLRELVSSRIQGKATLGFSKGNRPVELLYFPGKSKEKVLIIGGVHGSELSAVELAGTLSEKLASALLRQDVLLIPCLFPDNAAKARQANNKTNEGRYSCANGVDPNRQMPDAGFAFDPLVPNDAHGRSIERENQFLLQLIQEYKPQLIINLHAIRDGALAGFYADPRTDCHGIALGFEQDSLLAVQMARAASLNGGSVPGNHLDSIPSALYYKDPSAVMAGYPQKRNTEGSALKDDRGKGISLGTWATTAVCRGQREGYRAAISLITVEFPGYKTDRRSAKTEVNLRAYTHAILEALCSSVEENTVLTTAKSYSK